MIQEIAANAMEKYIKWKLKHLNNGLDWEKLSTDVGVGNKGEKSIVAHIKDTQKVYAFVYSDSELNWVDYVPLDPTVRMYCTDKVFKAIITGKIDVDQAFYGNLADVEGKNLIAEKFAANVLFSAFFTNEGYEQYSKIHTAQAQMSKKKAFEEETEGASE